MFFILELAPYENWRKKWRKIAFAHTLYSTHEWEGGRMGYKAK